MRWITPTPAGMNSSDKCDRMPRPVFSNVPSLSSCGTERLNRSRASSNNTHSTRPMTGPGTGTPVACAIASPAN